MPKDNAVINIADRRFLGSKIKLVGKENDDDKSQNNQGSQSEKGQMGGTNE